MKRPLPCFDWSSTCSILAARMWSCCRAAIAPPWYVNYTTDLQGGLDALERFAEHIRSFLPVDERKHVTASTAHKYKGREREAVIVLDADEGSYPLVHPNWVFLRVFGDSVESIEAEERRLFYVALTRAQHSLVILHDDPTRASPYLTDIKKHMPLDAIAWGELPPVWSLAGARLEVRVRFPYDVVVNAQLKSLQYRWDSVSKYWYRVVQADDFDMAALCAQQWAQGDVSIEIYSEGGELLKKAQ